MEVKMTYEHTTGSAYGALLLRVSLGTMYLTHGVVLKWMTFGLDGTAKFFESLGLPGPLAYATILAELVGGVLLIVGIQSRWVALALSPILFGAIWVHAGNGWVFTAPGGGWEYPLYLIILSAVQVLVGDGAFAVSSSRSFPLAISRSVPQFGQAL
jgi:putative oxidoreductase